MLCPVIELLRQFEGGATTHFQCRMYRNYENSDEIWLSMHLYQLAVDKVVETGA